MRIHNDWRWLFVTTISATIAIIALLFLISCGKQNAPKTEDNPPVTQPVPQPDPVTPTDPGTTPQPDPAQGTEQTTCFDVLAFKDLAQICRIGTPGALEAI